MKRIVVVVVLIAIVLMGMTSCLSSGPKTVSYVFDPSIPVEQSVKVRFSGIRPTTYNGININDALAKGADIFDLTMPAGDATFDIFFFMFRNTGTSINAYRITDKYFQYNFEPGKGYLVGLYMEPKPKESMKAQEDLYYIHIYDIRILDAMKSKKFKNDEERRRYCEEECLFSIFLFDSTDIR
jgi:hypothetical protein